MTAVLSQEENRLARSQPQADRLSGAIVAPLGPGGGGGSVVDGQRSIRRSAVSHGSRCSAHGAQRSTSAMRALYQFMNRLIDRLIVR